MYTDINTDSIAHAERISGAIHTDTRYWGGRVTVLRLGDDRSNTSCSLYVLLYLLDSELNVTIYLRQSTKRSIRTFKSKPRHSHYGPQLWPAKFPARLYLPCFYRLSLLRKTGDRG